MLSNSVYAIMDPIIFKRICMAKKARIIGMGSYLPDKVLSNSDLETMVATSDEWILTRVGIQERRIAAVDEFTSDLGAKSSRIAIERAGLTPHDIDMVIVTTSTPDFLVASTGCLIQEKLGLRNVPAFDLQAACSGFVYGLSLAKAYVESGLHKNVLLVSPEKLSAFTDYEDRNTCVLFGDGSGSAVISAQGEGLSIDAVSLGSDGSCYDLVYIPAGGSATPSSSGTLSDRGHYIKMEGREVFKHAVRRMNAAAEECLNLAGLKKEEISWVVPHQANLRIIEAVGKYMGVEEKKVYKTIHKYGNTSASTVAIALDELTQGHPIGAGEHLLLVAFGGGLTWGAVILTKVAE